MAQSSKVWGEVPLPEDLDSERTVVQRSQRFLDDDEDFTADEASGGRVWGHHNWFANQLSFHIET